MYTRRSEDIQDVFERLSYAEFTSFVQKVT